MTMGTHDLFQHMQKKEQDLKATSGDLEWTKELDKDIQAIHGQIDKFKKEIQDTEKGSKGKKNKKPQRR